MNLLLIDDDEELAGMLAEYLRGEGFAVTALHDGVSGVEAALSGRYALVVLDVMMPGMNGIEALSRIRLHSRLPVLMLTAKGDDLDRILGLELGADDYVPKPCTPRELAARVRAILRRTQNAPETDAALAVGPLALYPHKRAASWEGRPLDLTSTEFSLLEILARQAGQVVGKGELSEAALGRPLVRFDRSIDVHMSSIRQKLGARPDGESWIQTVRGRGYLFVKE
ncbi:two-component system, OmpR family, response regulator [Methylomagnum ishizawai]|uniref:Two-component system, OmpR family, response regulator n=1 Tax=Methylomagnum ishizawai TaxID=1760988 RepID=A0A1Y6CT80_9GAMM|nr:response regulator transcription factor [Methylomagnum ishizawai]SMF93849.1 two-component system, OmpR family, response regulator [Methylomagnum ishizawai]